MAWKLGIYFVLILAVAVQIAAAINENGADQYFDGQIVPVCVLYKQVSQHNII